MVMLLRHSVESYPLTLKLNVSKHFLLKVYSSQIILYW